MFRKILATSVGLAVSSLAATAGAQQLRYSDTIAGAIKATGNTLGLSHETGKNGPGTADSIGTFTSLDPTAVDLVPFDGSQIWFGGTTSNWMLNGSDALLDLAPESEIQYAELIWGGSTNYVDNVTAFLNTPVTLSFGGDTLSVSPDPATALTVDTTSTSTPTFAVHYYARSGQVTDFVKNHGAGTYAVEGVPATENEAINQLNAAGWTLIVAFHNSSEPVRNLSVFVGGSWVDEDTTQDYSVSGFCAPPTGQIDGKAYISALEGDANRTGDQLLIAPKSAGPFVNLEGPNNPAQNFFGSQINGDDGFVDTNGTFGTMNQDAINGVDIDGGRQGWDVTTVPVSSANGQLESAQTSAVLRTITTGDSFVPTLAAFEIDVNAPNFTTGTSAISVDKTTVTIGDVVKLTATLDNTGEATATNVKFTLPLESGLKLNDFKTDGVLGDVNGNGITLAQLTSGVDEGTLAPGEHRTVTLDLSVIGAPQQTAFPLHAVWAYNFVTCSGQSPLAETFNQVVALSYTAPTTSTSSSSSSGNASSTTTSGAGGSGGAGGGDSSSTATASGGSKTTGTGNGVDEGGGVEADSGCGCSTPGQSGSDNAALALIAAAGLVVASRRRRR